MTTSLRRLLVITGSFMAACLSSELIARQFFGLGRPVLSIPHPSVEYHFKPNQNLWRFGNHIAINSYGMRSQSMSNHAGSGTRRVLVFGDSIVFGGSQTDQKYIATEILRQRLRKSSSDVVEVGNVSAGSWGPGNWLAWSSTYGFLGASDVILVVSSHDAADNPTFEPLNPLTHPTTNPPSALYELLSRYLNPSRLIYQLESWGFLKSKAPQLQAEARKDGGEKESDKRPKVDVDRGLADLKAFLEAAKESGARVSVVQFWERKEMTAGKPLYEHKQIKDLVQSLNIPIFQSREDFVTCSPNPAAELYVDAIHPYTLKGQQCLANSLWRALHHRGF